MQHLSVSEGNLETTPTSQLQIELWLERTWNQLQRRLNDRLFCTFTQLKPLPESEAEIFQTLVEELNAALGTVSIALALTDAATMATAPTTELSYKVNYVTAIQTKRIDGPSLPLVGLTTGQSLYFQLGQVFTLAQLQSWQTQKPQLAWQICADQTLLGWLVIAIPPAAEWDLAALKTQYTPQLIERSLAAVELALIQIRQLQTLSLQCQQLTINNQELVRSNQLKSEFLANTSHEIRTPLSSILGFTHLLQAQGFSPDNLRHQQYLSIILNSGQHLLALINDILDLSKIEANQLEVQRELVDVTQLCYGVTALVKEKVSDKGLQLCLEIDSEVTTLIADSLRLKQMLFNLLSNALKFTPQGTVGLRVKSQGMFLHFTVWDTGIGIPSDEQTKLFQPYSQIANVVAGRQEGTGLGLALTQKLAELHGGRVEVQSELNRGSQFTVVLPLGERETRDSSYGKLHGNCELRTTAPLHSSSLVASLQPLAQLLLVEDNVHNAKLMQTYLKKLGYQVVWAKNAERMWQALDSKLPALILMDVHLPDIDGLTLLQQLQAHEQYRQIPAIAQTAMAMKGDRESCLAAGAVDYISKPIDLKFLAQLVSKYASARAI